MVVAIIRLEIDSVIEYRQSAGPLRNDVSELALLDADLDNIDLVVVMRVVRRCRRCEAA